MNNLDVLKRRFPAKRWLLAMLTVTLVLYWCPNRSGADFNTITASDIQYSDPFEITASIMEIDYAKNLLIVAEHEVYVVDLIIGGEFIKTVLTDAHGEALLFDFLKRGQTVTVSGMKLPDGRVIAEELVQQSPRTGD